ncbi:hypothetical protein CCR96_11190 [Halochromatium roseum]|nr:hypothetical protein [Halochromatium roseum]
MKGTTALLKTWKGPKPASAETVSLIEDGEVREFHQGTRITSMMIPLKMPDRWPQRFLRPNSDFPLASRGGPYMAPLIEAL